MKRTLSILMFKVGNSFQWTKYVYFSYSKNWAERNDGFPKHSTFVFQNGASLYGLGFLWLF